MDKILILIGAIFLGVLAIGVLLISGITNNLVSSLYFKPILNITGLSNSSQIVTAIQNGTSYYDDFNISYSASASASLFPISRYSATLSISRSGNLLKLALSTQNPNILLGNESIVGEYSSVSEYNGSGFLLCESSSQACKYEKANQNEDYSTEIDSALSNLFSADFLEYPYLSIMNDNASLSDSNSFVLTYLNSQNYNGNECADYDVESTTSFAMISGLSVSGTVCFSEALGLPLYGQATVTYKGVNLAVSFSSVLYS